MKNSFSDDPNKADTSKPRTLIFSQRNLTRIQPYRCAHFEFEDVIAQIENSAFLAPKIDLPQWHYPLARQLAYHTPIRLNPGVGRAEPISSEVDLFFAICGDPTDLLRINALPNWRSRCRKAVCLIDEAWAREIPNYRNYFQMLKQFDLVVLYYSQSVDRANEIIGEQKCMFLPPGVDAVHFCPYPDPPARTIHVYSIGRRSAATHKSFLRMAEKDGTLYLHDSTSADRVLDPVEHRTLVASIAKRSLYYIVNPGLIDRPDIRGDQIEIGNRYFEGAASGNILLGERPRNGQFEKLFDWPDSLIDLPYDSPDAEDIVRELDRQPERQAMIQKANIHQALLRHDWVYRWESILRAVGLAPLPQIESRKKQLRHLADQVMGDDRQAWTMPAYVGRGSQMRLDH